MLGDEVAAVMLWSVRGKTSAKIIEQYGNTSCSESAIPVSILELPSTVSDGQDLFSCTRNNNIHPSTLPSIKI
jgi:hypothetical protein